MSRITLASEIKRG